MREIVRKSRLLLLMLAVVLGVSGCSTAPEQGDIYVEKEYVEMQETIISGADEALRTMLTEEKKIGHSRMSLFQDVIYRIVSVVWENEDAVTAVELYLQTLEAPYTQWESRPLGEMVELDEIKYMVSQVVFGQEGQLYCILWGLNGQYLAKYSPGEISEMVCALPKEDSEYEVAVDAHGRVYSFMPQSKQLSLLAEDGSVQQVKQLTGAVCGLIGDAASGQDYVYGFDIRGKLCLWDLESGQDIFLTESDLILNDFYGDFSVDGALYFADTKGIWKYGEQLEQYCVFSEEDYFLDKIYGLEVAKDGSLTVLAQIEGSDIMLRVEKKVGKVKEKEEIVIAFIENHAGLNKLIRRFNRQSESYRITSIYPEPGMEWSTFRNQIQMEVSAGGGPDIFGSDFLLSPEDYIENGYLTKVETVWEAENQYLHSAIEEGKSGGVLYGIPYDCQFRLVVYPESLVGDVDSLTMEVLMEAVENSDAKVLQSGLTAMGIVYEYGLFDHENPTYIDWEQGESHLDQEPFKRLLEFAKAYGDVQESYEQKLKWLQTGDAVAYHFDLTKLQDLHKLAAYVQGEPRILGYPSAEGRGIYTRARYLYMNANAKCPEGATEFFHFILSKEQQEAYVDDYLDHSNWENWEKGWRAQLPIHLEAYQRLVSLQYREKGTIMTGDGELLYEAGPLSEQEEAYLYEILEYSKPGNWKVSYIGDILEEELEPYFSGAKTVEEVVGILDSRVQTYLDEHHK